MASGAVTGLELMERAGTGIVEAVLAHWPDFAIGSHRAVVLSGPGNNGGDGFVVARQLRARGWEVDVFVWGDPAKLPPDARANYERLDPVTPFDAAAFAKRASHMPDLEVDPAEESPPPFLVVDALFGIGLVRPLPDLGGAAWHWDYLMNFRDLNAARVVAVDVPSGLDADTGEVVGGTSATTILPADLTVTFHRLKPGHVDGSGAKFCGDVVVKDIGL